ncbi:MAG TPA: nuclear transport factor 2 family protein [Microvirga sp.]|nr:nuclear transport factor 2 family protein [Microvirga sp.]
MNRRLPFLTVAVWLLAVPPAWAGPEDDVLALDQEWLLSYNTQDAGPVRRIWADDARLIASTGDVKSKAQEIGDVTSAPPMSLSAKWSVADRSVRQYGDTAVVIGRFTQTGTSGGQPFERSYRYTNVYARLGGEWRLVNSQFARH